MRFNPPNATKSGSRSGERSSTNRQRIEARTHHRKVPRLRAHLDLPEIIWVVRELRHHILRPPGSDVMGEQYVRHPRARARGLGGEVENRQAPLRERNYPLPMKVCDDGCRRQPLPHQVPQRVGEHLEPGLMRWGRYPPVPLIRPLPEHLVGERREPVAEVAQVKPPSGSPGVIGGHLAGDVQVRPVPVHMEHEAAGASVPLWLAPHVLDEELAAE